MARRPAEFLPPAAEELAAAADWYRAHNPEAAEAFVRAIERAVRAVTDAPQRYPAYRLGTRRYILRRFPFAIVFRELADRVQIVAVAHASRRPGYWRGR
jgi:plasmid stabilization system protein ParE